MLPSVEQHSPAERQHEVERLRAQLDELSKALETREVVGQATGILMVTNKSSLDQAFQELLRRSKATNRKLCDIARELVANMS